MTPVQVILPDRAVRAKLRRDGKEAVLSHQEWLMFDELRRRPGCYVLTNTFRLVLGIQDIATISMLRNRLHDKIAPLGLEIQSHHFDGYRVVLKPVAPAFEEASE